jgi:hypothetical protein
MTQTHGLIRTSVMHHDSLFSISSVPLSSLGCNGSEIIVKTEEF